MQGLFNGKIGSRLQIALFFLFYEHFQPPSPIRFFDSPPYLILHNVPIPLLIRTPRLFGPQEQTYDHYEWSLYVI